MQIWSTTSATVEITLSQYKYQMGQQVFFRNTVRAQGRVIGPDICVVTGHAGYAFQGATELRYSVEISGFELICFESELCPVQRTEIV